MFQSLLAERFGLRYHFESRATGTYALVVAKGGPKLKEAGRVEGGYHYKYPGMTMQNCASFLNQGTFDLPVVGPHSPPATTPANWFAAPPTRAALPSTLPCKSSDSSWSAANSLASASSSTTSNEHQPRID